MPEPTLVRARVPDPFWITPEKVLDWLLLPALKVIEPVVPEVTVPLPASPASVGL